MDDDYYLIRKQNGETLYLIKGYLTGKGEVWTTNKSKAHRFENQEEIDGAKSWWNTRRLMRGDNN